MNKVRRATIEVILQKLDDISCDIEFVLDEEQDCLDNLPENLESSEMYQKMEYAVTNLGAALDSIESAKDFLEDSKL